MEAIRDMTWLRQLALTKAESFELRGFKIAILSITATPSHHQDRFLYRLLAFDPGLGRPVLSVDLESDILGDYCLSLQLGGEHRVLARYEALPSLEEFRTRAIAQAEALLPAAGPRRSGKTDTRPRTRRSS